MNKSTKQKFSKRVFSYLWDMKKSTDTEKGNESETARRIADDVEIYSLGLTSKVSDLENQLNNITRFEVIDTTGRVYSKWNCKIEKSIQDGGRTLKIFVKENG